MSIPVESGFESVPVGGLTGATAASRYAGATASGAPVAGTFAVGDFVIDHSGSAWVCTAAGTPGTWAQLGAAGAVLNTQGGQDVIKAHGSLGAAATFSPADGNVHTGTLTANCTVTLAAPVGTGACTLELWLTEDGTGGWTVAWPGSVTEQGTHATTLGTTSRVIVESVDGGTTWIAAWLGGSGGGVGTFGLLVEDGVTAPPVNLYTEDGTDWLYADG